MSILLTPCAGTVNRSFLLFKYTHLHLTKVHENYLYTYSVRDFYIVGNVYAQDSTSIDRHLVLFRTYDRRTVHFENLPADTAVYFTSQALRIARKNGYQLGQVRMLCRLADINEHYGNLAMAVKCQTEAIQIAQHSVQKNYILANECPHGSAYGKTR